MRIPRLGTSLAALLLAAPVARAQLIHHWDFNSGTVTDLIGGATPVSNTASVSGGMLQLNQSTPGWVDFGSQYLIPTSGDFTIKMTYRTLFDPNPGYLELFSQGDVGSAFYIGAQYNHDEFRLGDQWQNSGFAWVEDNLFHTLVYQSIDGGAAKVFFDGVQVSNMAIGPDLLATGSGLRLGRQYGANGEYVNADIDDLRIYQGIYEPGEEAVVPEPASIVLVATGIAAIGAVTRRRRR